MEKKNRSRSLNYLAWKCLNWRLFKNIQIEELAEEELRLVEPIPKAQLSPHFQNIINKIEKEAPEYKHGTFMEQSKKQPAMSLEECKDEIAKSRGFGEWQQLKTAAGYDYLEKRMNEVAELYANQFRESQKWVSVEEVGNPSNGNPVKALIHSIIVAIILYFLFSFYSESFDISLWEQDVRGKFCGITGFSMLCAFFISIGAQQEV